MSWDNKLLFDKYNRLPYVNMVNQNRNEVIRLTQMIKLILKVYFNHLHVISIQYVLGMTLKNEEYVCWLEAMLYLCYFDTFKYSKVETLKSWWNSNISILMVLSGILRMFEWTLDIK